MNSRTRSMLCGIGFLLVILFAALLLAAPPDGAERGELSQFLGRFHPLVVHFPIALVLLVAALEAAGFSQKGKQLQFSAGFVLGLATVSALLSVSLGWLLARSGGYEGALVTRHMWGGVSLAGALVLCCALRGWNAKGYGAALFAAVCLLIWTSDQGGRLTHGDNFLTEHLPSELRRVLGIPAPPLKRRASANAERSSASAGAAASGNATVAFFDARVEPIFEDNCTTCHGPEKKKGKLRLDSFDLVMKGGKDGLVVKPGDPKGSELFRRINLPRDHKDAMPAEGKPGLSALQIKVIELWIATGATQSVSAEAVRQAPPVPPPSPLTPALTGDYRPRTQKIQALQTELGILLVPRSQNPRDGLILRTATAPERCDDAALARLKPIADLIVDAELARTKITDAGLKTLANFPNLLNVDLSHTAITSRGLAPLNNLGKLESLNLTATDVDDRAILPLRHKPGIRLYLFETKTSDGGKLAEGK